MENSINTITETGIFYPRIPLCRLALCNEDGSGPSGWCVAFTLARVVRETGHRQGCRHASALMHE